MVVAHQVVNHQSQLNHLVEMVVVAREKVQQQNLHTALLIVTIVSNVVIWVDGLTVKKK